MVPIFRNFAWGTKLVATIATICAKSDKPYINYFFHNSLFVAVVREGSGAKCQSTSRLENDAATPETTMGSAKQRA